MKLCYITYVLMNDGYVENFMYHDRRKIKKLNSIKIKKLKLDRKKHTKRLWNRFKKRSMMVFYIKHRERLRST